MNGSSLYPEDLTNSLLFGDHVFSWIGVSLASDGIASHGSKEAQKGAPGILCHICEQNTMCGEETDGGRGGEGSWEGRVTNSGEEDLDERTGCEEN